MSHQPVIEVRNMGVCYTRRSGLMRSSKFWALHDVSFQLNHGESIGIVGHNGAGKSTLLRVLAGILAPDRGEVVMHGGRASLLSLQIGFIPYLSGRENAVLSGILLGLTRREVLARMDEIVGFAELGDFIDEPMRSYSSGMKARLGFAVAFQADPDVLLIDEVLGVGDAAFRAKSSAVMREKIESDKTVVLVTHSEETVLELCDRAVWIDHGVTRAVGPAEEVMELYRRSAPAVPDKARAGKA
jgi:lipopolysaccharide transport system ATP-binding protein